MLWNCKKFSVAGIRYCGKTVRREPGCEGFVSHTKSLGFILEVVCRGVIYMLFRDIPVSAF